jgi:hypothetical protein
MRCDDLRAIIKRGCRCQIKATMNTSNIFPREEKQQIIGAMNSGINFAVINK